MNISKSPIHIDQAATPFEPHQVNGTPNLIKARPLGLTCVLQSSPLAEKILPLHGGGQCAEVGM